MIKAFLFDYDGVITEGAENDRIFRTLASNLNISVEQATEWLMEIWRPFLKGKLSSDEVWQFLEEKIGRQINELDRDIWFKWAELRPLPEMIELVNTLKTQCFKVGVISNVFKETAQVIQKNGGYDVFDIKVLSCELGFAKPDQEIYHRGLEKLPGILPHEIVFLDDRETNVDAANQLGMLGIYVANHADAIEKVKELANTDEELVDILSDNDKVLRQELKTEAHKHGWKHKTVLGYLKFGDGWSLVRQAADRQDPGQLVPPVGGHVKAGETEIDALLRESEEEIGTRNIKYKHVGDKVFHRQVIGRDENHLFAVYEIETDDPIKLNEESVAIERFKPSELKEALKEHPEEFGDAYYFVLESFYPEYLPKEYKKRWS